MMVKGHECDWKDCRKEGINEYKTENGGWTRHYCDTHALVKAEKDTSWNWGFFIGISVGIIATIVITMVSMPGMWGDKGDIVNVRAMGTELCGEYGLTYSYRDFNNNTLVPRIHCINNTKLIDDIVVLNKGSR
jgi:hypothetical protein